MRARRQQEVRDRAKRDGASVKAMYRRTLEEAKQAEKESHNYQAQMRLLPVHCQSLLSQVHTFHCLKIFTKPVNPISSHEISVARQSSRILQDARCPEQDAQYCAPPAQPGLPVSYGIVMRGCRCDSREDSCGRLSQCMQTPRVRYQLDLIHHNSSTTLRSSGVT